MRIQTFSALDNADSDTENTYKRLKLGRGQAYDRSSDYAAVVTWVTEAYILYM
jgi:hypothetical protein